MISVICASRHLRNLDRMKKNNPVSASTVTGTGEFARKEKHVIATVEIHGGVIRSAAFACADGAVPEGSEELVDMFVGRTVPEALALNAISFGQRVPELCEVLLEAFHRAVETCLDPQ
jgi:hypothetical protein